MKFFTIAIILRFLANSECKSVNTGSTQGGGILLDYFTQKFDRELNSYRENPYYKTVTDGTLLHGSRKWTYSSHTDPPKYDFPASQSNMYESVQQPSVIPSNLEDLKEYDADLPLQTLTTEIEGNKIIISTSQLKPLEPNKGEYGGPVNYNFGHQIEILPVELSSNYDNGKLAHFAIPKESSDVQHIASSNLEMNVESNKIRITSASNSVKTGVNGNVHQIEIMPVRISPTTSQDMSSQQVANPEQYTNDTRQVTSNSAILKVGKNAGAIISGQPEQYSDGNNAGSEIEPMPIKVTNSQEGMYMDYITDPRKHSNDALEPSSNTLIEKIGKHTIKITSNLNQAGREKGGHQIEIIADENAPHFSDEISSQQFVDSEHSKSLNLEKNEPSTPPVQTSGFEQFNVESNEAGHINFIHSSADHQTTPEVHSNIGERLSANSIDNPSESNVFVLETEKINDENVNVQTISTKSETDSVDFLNDFMERNNDESTNTFTIADDSMKIPGNTLSILKEQFASSQERNEDIDDVETSETESDDFQNFVTGELNVGFDGSGDEGLSVIKSSEDEINPNKEGRLLSMFSRRNGTIPCTTPKGETGQCRRITQCLLSDALNNFNLFLQYMCLVGGVRVGVCCPDNPVIEITNTDDDNSTEPTENIAQPPEGCGLNRKTRIVGGSIAVPHEWTWMVALMRRNRFFCGGAIINNWYILTAAHCIMGVNVKDLKVRLGEYNFNTQTEHQEDIPVAEIKRHAQFVTLTFQHDIALLKLKRAIQYTKFVGSICLPSEPKRDFSDVNATVVGWGTVSFGGAASPILRQVMIPVWKNEDCDRTYLLETINESFMCAGSPENGEDACQGDSGGPLMTLNKGHWEVIGIVSWGRRCGDPTYPGVYTRVTTYLDWIQQNAV